METVWFHKNCICCDLRKQTPAKSVLISLGARAHVCTGLASALGNAEM